MVLLQLLHLLSRLKSEKSTGSKKIATASGSGANETIKSICITFFISTFPHQVIHSLSQV